MNRLTGAGVFIIIVFTSLLIHGYSQEQVKKTEPGEQAFRYCYKKPTFYARVAVGKLAREVQDAKNLLNTLEGTSYAAFVKPLTELFFNADNVSFFGFVNTVPEFILVIETDKNLKELETLFNNFGIQSAPAEIEEAKGLAIDGRYIMVPAEQRLVIAGPRRAVEEALYLRNETAEKTFPLHDFLKRGDKALFIATLNVKGFRLAELTGVRKPALVSMFNDVREAGIAFGENALLASLSFDSPDVAGNAEKILNSLIEEMMAEARQILRAFDGSEDTTSPRVSEHLAPNRILAELLSSTKLRTERNELLVMVKFEEHPVKWVDQKYLPVLAPYLAKNQQVERNYEKAEECLNNIILLEAAVEDFVIDHGANTSPTVEQLHADGYTKKSVTCPDGGIYRISIDASNAKAIVSCDRHGDAEKLRKIIEKHKK